MIRPFIVSAVIAALLLTAAGKTVFGQTVEQRLGATIAALIVENARLATELEAAKQALAKLHAEKQENK